MVDAVANEGGQECSDSALYSAEYSRRLLLSLACLQSACSTGVLFGFSALAAALLEKGEYSELCAGAEAEAQLAADGACTAQTLRFSLIYTFASTCLFSAFLVFGLIVDRFGGPLRANLAGTGLVALGLLVLSQSNSKTLDLFPLGFALIGLGGPGVHISLFHVALLFPAERKNTIQSLIVGAFVWSGIAFPVERWLIQDLGQSRAQILAAHGVILCCLGVVGMRIWPETKFKPGDAIRFHRNRLLCYVVVSKASLAAADAAAAGSQGVASHRVASDPVASGGATCQGMPMNVSTGVEGTGKSQLLVEEQGVQRLQGRGAAKRGDRSPQEDNLGGSRAGPELKGFSETPGANSVEETPEERLEAVSSESCANAGHAAVAVVRANGEGGGAVESELRHLHGLPLKSQLLTVEYTRLAIFMIVHALHFNFYLGTFIQQIADVYVRDPSVSGAEVDQTEISNVVQSFSLSLAVCMPVCGVMAIPLVGYILDSRPLRSGGFLVCNMTGVLYGGLALVPVVGVQWLTIVVLSVHRVFLFASLFAYSGSRFGPANFGSIVGVTTFLASVCGLLQYVLALLAEAYGYVAINLVVLLMLVPLFVLPY